MEQRSSPDFGRDLQSGEGILHLQPIPQDRARRRFPLLDVPVCQIQEEVI